MTAKPTANEATSAAAAASAHRRDECTSELASRSPPDLNIGGAAAIGCVGALEDAAGLRTTSVGRGGATLGRGASGEVPAAGGVPGVGATAIGRDGRAPRCRTPLSTSRLAPFSNRSNEFENSPGDAKGGASTAWSPRAIA